MGSARSWKQRACMGAVLLATILASTLGHGRPAARLWYTRAQGAETCPDGATLAARVAERLGYAPFRPDAEATVDVRFARERDTYRASVVLVDVRGTAVGRRELASDVPDCGALAESVVLTVTILLDDPSLRREPDRAQPSRPTEAPAPIPPPGPPDRKGAPDRIGARMGAGLLFGGGFAPGATLGVAVHGGAAARTWSVDVEGRFDLPSEASYSEGTVKTSLRLGQLVPCVHRGLVLACAVLGAGAIATEGSDVEHPRRVTSFYALAGARGGIEAPMNDLFAFRFAIDALASLTPKTVGIGDVDVWTSPPIGIALGVGVFGRFP